MPLDSPLVSVVIPTFNRAALVGRAIRSVLAGTVADIEVLVIDDGSTDDTADVVAAIGDPRVKFIRQENAGANAARNCGIEAARGRFVAFQDSDDEWLPQRLAAQLAILDAATDPANTVVFGRVEFRWPDGKRQITPRTNWQPGMNLADYTLCDDGATPTQTLLLPQDLAVAVRFWPGLSFGQEHEFCWRLQQHGAAFVFVPDVLAILHVHGDGHVSRNLSYASQIDCYRRHREYFSCRARGVFLAQRIGLRALAMGHRFRGMGFMLRAVRYGGVSWRTWLRALALFVLPKSLIDRVRHQRRQRAHAVEKNNT